MLDARGNLDLESPEELLTSSGTLGPRTPLGPSERMAFWRFIFASFFGVFVLFFHVCLMDFDLHFGAMLASFSMFVALLFRASILHGFVINFGRMFIYFLKYFFCFRRPASNWRNPQKHLFLNDFCIVYTFASTCLFHNCRDMFRCSLLHHLLLHFGSMLASFWYKFRIKLKFFRYKLSNNSLVCFPIPFGT